MKRTRRIHRSPKLQWAKRALLAAWAAVSSTVAVGQTGAMTAPTFHWRCAGGETLLNHNAAVRLSDSTMVFDSLPYAKDYTMIVVYRPDTNGETSLWQLTFGDGAMRGLMNNNVMH